jgi:hypothetical protein
MKSKIQHCCLQETHFTIIVAGYKIDAQKSVTFLCTKNEQSQKEIRKPISLPIPSKNLNT